MDPVKIKIYGSRGKVDSMKKVAELEEAGKNKMRESVKGLLLVGQMFSLTISSFTTFLSPSLLIMVL